MHFLISPLRVEMLALIGFTGKILQNLANCVGSGFAVIQPEIRIYAAVRICDKLQIPVQYGIGKSTEQVI